MRLEKVDTAPLKQSMSWKVDVEARMGQILSWYNIASKQPVHSVPQKALKSEYPLLLCLVNTLKPQFREVLTHVLLYIKIIF